jgi:hypothetical protein
MATGASVWCQNQGSGESIYHGATEKDVYNGKAMALWSPVQSWFKSASSGRHTYGRRLDDAIQSERSAIVEHQRRRL